MGHSLMSMSAAAALEPSGLRTMEFGQLVVEHLLGGVVGVDAC
jgi:hypothetical protein